MSDKAFIAAITVSLLLISSLAGMLAVEVAEANPFFMFHQVDQVPGTIPPNITIYSPKNNTAYSSNNITVSFNVDRPQLNGCRGTAIIDVKYTLDGATTQAFSIWRGNSASNSNAIPEYNTTFALPSLPAGTHSLTVYADAVVYVVDLDIFFINSSSTTLFATSTQPREPTPTPSPSASVKQAMAASLSESASALNFGNRINFTVSVEGGKVPYTYVWYVDNQLVETNSSPYYSTDNLALGSHHVHAEVRDADNNTAKTLTVAFEVLPNPSSTVSPSFSPSISPSAPPSPTTTSNPTQRGPTPSPSDAQENFAPTLIIAGLVIVAVVVVGLLVYLPKDKGEK